MFDVGLPFKPPNMTATAPYGNLRIGQHAGELNNSNSTLSEDLMVTSITPPSAISILEGPEMVSASEVCLITYACEIVKPEIPTAGPVHSWTEGPELLRLHRTVLEQLVPLATSTTATALHRRRTYHAKSCVLMGGAPWACDHGKSWGLGRFF